MPNKTKSNTTRTLHSKCGGYMGGRLLSLPGEISWTRGNRVRTLVETRFTMRSQQKPYYYEILDIIGRAES